MSLPRSTPARQHVDARGLLAFLDAVERDDLGLHSLMVLRHGHVVAEGWWTPYAADRAQLVYSLSKTLTATAVGFLAQEHRLGLVDPVLDHLPEADRARAAPGWEHVQVRHCLSMTVGHHRDAWPEAVGAFLEDEAAHEDWLPRVLAVPLDHEPGTHFAYDQVATYVLSLVVRAITGQGPAEVLRPRLLDPLGLPEVPWQPDPLGRELGFTGAHLTTEAIASVAQLYLDDGVWQGRRLLAADWIAAATRRFGPLNEAEDANGPDWRRGYGYSFWMQRHGYRGDGAFGQFLVVLPEQDAVVAITSEDERMQAVLDALWQHVVPALGSTADPVADEGLAARLGALEIRPLRGEAEPDAVSAEVTGSDVPRAWCEVRVEGDVLHLRRGEDWLRVRVGDGRWPESVVRADGIALPVVASGGWQDATTYRAEVLLVETPHRFEVLVRRDGTASLRWRHLPLNGPDPFRSGVHRA